jgi:hypothetical protein
MGRYLDVHTAGATRGEMEAWLDAAAERETGGTGQVWWWPSRDRPVLMVWLDDWSDWESDDWARLAERLGTDDFVSIGARRMHGWTGEVDFVLAVLARFGGVAEDDYGDSHYWTHDEIASGARVGGLRFFETRPVAD